MAYVTKDRLKKILDPLPDNDSRKAVLDRLVSRGNIVEGLNDQNVPGAVSQPKYNEEQAGNAAEAQRQSGILNKVANVVGAPVRSGIAFGRSVMGAPEGGTQDKAALAGQALKAGFTNPIPVVGKPIQAARQGTLPVVGNVAENASRLAARYAPNSKLAEKAAQVVGIGTGMVAGMGAEALPSTAADLAALLATGPTATKKIIKPVAGKIGKVAGSIYDYFATSPIAGGIPKSSWQWFKNNVADTVAMIGKSPEEADGLAQKFKGAVSSAVEQLEDFYKRGAKALTEKGGEPVRVDLTEVANKARNLVDEDFGYFNPERNADTPEAEFFRKKIYDRLNKYKYSDATPQGVYEFQKDLNGYLRDKRGTTLGAALGKVKGLIKEKIDATPSLKSISEINKAWSDAIELEDMAKSTANANDLVKKVRSIYNAEGDTVNKQKLDFVMQRVKGAEDAVRAIRSYESAKDVGKVMRGFPATGYGAAALYEAGKMGAGMLTNPATVIAAPTALAFSPRAYTLGYRGAQQLAKGAGQRYVTPATLAALAAARKLRQQQAQNQQP